MARAPRGHPLLAGLVAGVVAIAVATVPEVASASEVTWAAMFGSANRDHGTAVSATTGAVYVGGVTSGHLPTLTNKGFDDAFLRKFDDAGAVQWTVQFGTNNYDAVMGISARTDGVYAGGFTRGTLQASAGGLDAYVRKFDTSGGVLWTRQFGTAADEAVLAVTSDASGVVVAGWTTGELQGTSSGKTDAFVRKFDSSGNAVWTRQFGGTGDERAEGVSLSSGNIYVGGYTTAGLPSEAYGGGRDGFIRKYDSAGNAQWTDEIGTANTDVVSGVSARTDGIYVSGFSGGTLPAEVSAGGSDAFVRKYSSGGSEAWTEQFGSSGGDVALAVSATSSRVYVVGYTTGTFPGESFAGDNDAFLGMLDAAGNLVRTREFGTSGWEGAMDVSATSASAYFAGAGNKTLFGHANSGGFDAFAGKYVLSRPDALIGTSAASQIGGGVYNTDGTGQTKSGQAETFDLVTFFVTGQNDGPAAEPMKVKGCGSSIGWGVKYLAGTAGSTDITTQVVAGTYSLGSLAPGGSKSLRVQILHKNGAQIGSFKSCLITVRSSTETTARDTVKARVKALAATAREDPR
jgi:hypothetical protein